MFQKTIRKNISDYRDFENDLFKNDTKQSKSLFTNFIAPLLQTYSKWVVADSVAAHYSIVQ